MPKPEAPRIVVAMDYGNVDDCLTMARRLSPTHCRLKVGKELFTRGGPAVVEQLQSLGFDVFLDLKFHDIPNTVAGAVRAAAELGVWMVNVHASGGERMMATAREALERASGPRPLLIGVTVLTSLSEAELHDIGVHRSPLEQVLHLAELSQRSGLDGVVCSALEADALRRARGEDFCLVTPGIRPADSGADDQRRTLTPEQAMAKGSHYLVIGRPITQAADPIARCRAIAAQIDRS